MRRVFRVAYAVGMIFASMMPATAQAPAPAIAPDTGKISQAWWASYFKDSRLVVLADGRKLNLLCQGSGGPVVVLESGLGSGAWAWRFLQPMLSAHTKVCSYDRAGYGLSPPTELSRSAGSEAYDLAQLVDGAVLVTGPLFRRWVTPGAKRKSQPALASPPPDQQPVQRSCDRDRLTLMGFWSGKRDSNSQNGSTIALICHRTVCTVNHVKNIATRIGRRSE